MDRRLTRTALATMQEKYCQNEFKCALKDRPANCMSEQFAWMKSVTEQFPRAPNPNEQCSRRVWKMRMGLTRPL